jgi:hypothetical protein
LDPAAGHRTPDLVRLAALLEGLHAYADDSALPAIEVSGTSPRPVPAGVTVDVVDPEGRV